MINKFALALVMVSVMPSSPAVAVSKEQLYEANARYRYYRHHHRARHKPHLYQPVRPSPPAPEVARSNLEPLNRQGEVPYTGVDISAMLTPVSWLVPFTPDPGTAKLAAVPLTIKYVPEPDKKLFYLFAIVMLGLLGTGMTHELNKARTCHKSLRNSEGDANKRGRYGLLVYDKSISWVPSWVRRRWDALRSLT